MNSFFNKDDLLSLDVMLDQAESQATNNEDLIRRLDKHHIKIEGDISIVLGSHPLSEDYMDGIKAIHQDIIGKCYSTNFEGLPVLNPAYERDWPYPWGTKSPETVARFLISYGFLIKTADLSPNARILEVGCGVGSLTWNLARMGYRVDALDPNEVQCNIVRTATRDFPVPPSVMAMTLDQWLAAKTESYKYDVVIFFESFHHILNHRDSLHQILNAHLEEDGRILLAAEPVLEGTCERLPYPWGPRLDGESMRAMRRWGWLELGFTEDYLRQLFTDLGMTFNWVKCNEALPLSQIVIGRQITGNQESNDDDLHYEASFEDGIRFAKKGMPAFVESIKGLAEWESWGRWSIGDAVSIRFKEKLPSNFSLNIELADVFGPNVHKMLQVHAGDVTVSQTLNEIGVQRCYQFEFHEVDTNVLEIGIPHPFRPKDIVKLGNEDPRRIGLGFVALTIEGI